MADEFEARLREFCATAYERAKRDRLRLREHLWRLWHPEEDSAIPLCRAPATHAPGCECATLSEVP